jgi:pilus assembly protein CpaE
MADKSKLLSVTLIVPNAARRMSLASALAGSRFTIARELDRYPSPDELAELARLACDVVIVDLDADVEQAIGAIESICHGSAPITVMAYCSRNDPLMMRRSMQAGAREFLTDPLLPETVSELHARASGRQPKQASALGKMLLLLPSKGGVGVTTVAVNLALALKRESGAKVVVVDMDFQLGEVALGLGMIPTFSVVDALMNPERLDKEFLATLLLRHNSGLAVLAAAEKFNFFHVPREGAHKLFQILREEFDYVVVDAGTSHSHIQETLFDLADTLYVVTELNFPALRNAHRLMSFLATRDQTGVVEVVLNRHNSHDGDIDEKSAVKAMGQPIKWRVPNGYATARAAQNTGVPLASGSPVARALTQIARAACGKPLSPMKTPGRGFSLFRSSAKEAQVTP